MVTLKQPLRKVGGSLMISIPHKLVLQYGFREGQTVNINLEKPTEDFFGMFRFSNAYDKKKDRAQFKHA